MLVHVFDVLEQRLSFGPDEDAFPGAIQQLHREQRLKPADPPADSRMIEMKLPRCSMQAAMPRHFKEYAQIVPFRSVARSRGTPVRDRIHAMAYPEPNTTWCKKTP